MILMIHKALLDIRQRGKKPPIFIVEVNNQRTSKHIFDLLVEFESQILETVDFKSYDLKKVNMIHKALLDIRQRGKKPPIFIVEVNNQRTSKHIFDLLVEFESQILETVDFKSYDLKKVNMIHKAMLDICRKGKNQYLLWR